MSRRQRYMSALPFPVRLISHLPDFEQQQLRPYRLKTSSATPAAGIFRTTLGRAVLVAYGNNILTSEDGGPESATDRTY